MESELEVYFVLVRPKLPENIGFTARVIKNFGFTRLALIAPRCDLSRAYITAAHAKDVLEKAKVYSSLEDFVRLEEINYLIGTTARPAESDKNPRRVAILSHELRNYPLPRARIAVLLGPEDFGLSNEELKMCDLIVTIPTSPAYPAMNVSHAAAVLAYELSLALKTGRKLYYRPTTPFERQVLLEAAREAVRAVYPRMPEDKRRLVEEILEHVLKRAFITGRETHTLIGFFRKICELLKASSERESHA